ncbi:MAG: AAA family ATPase [Acidobacteria bacterium]|nr:AAA family ATPase [Acidobacteriota bacterium]
MVVRHFNTAGAVRAGEHYLIPPLERINLGEVLGLIEAGKYFVLHAPRQTGKTSTMLALVDELNRGGRYKALYINVEAAQTARNDVEAAMKAILGVLARRAKLYLKDHHPDRMRKRVLASEGPNAALAGVLQDWSSQSPLPICLVMDEIDALVGDSLVSVLPQLRSGYDQRPDEFPESVILCGVRDVRGAFNIKAASLTIGNFSPNEIRRLYEQHTAATGQRFEEDVYSYVWELNSGPAVAGQRPGQRGLLQDRAGPRTADYPRPDLSGQGKLDPQACHASGPTGGQAERAAGTPRDRTDGPEQRFHRRDAGQRRRRTVYDRHGAGPARTCWT